MNLNLKSILIMLFLLFQLNNSLPAQTLTQNEKPIESLQLEKIYLKDNNASNKQNNDQEDPGQNYTKEEKEISWSNGQYLTGNWNTLRSRLEDHGIQLSVSYTSDPFCKVSGGLTNHTKTKYLGLVNFGLALNTEKMGLWKRGNFYFAGQNLHGHGITHQQVGSIQVISSIDAYSLTHFSEFWYSHEIITDKFKIKVGKQDASNDFFNTNAAFDFINSSLTVNPTIPMPAYPEQGLGAIIFTRLYKGLTFKTGIYDGQPKGEDFGFKTTFDSNGGTFYVFEPSIEHSIKGLYGKYIVGMWYHSGKIKEIGTSYEDTQDLLSTIHNISTASPRNLTSRYGIYASFQQMIYKELKNPDQGLSVLGEFGWTPAKDNQLSKYYAGGLYYQGLIPGRDSDTAGIAFALADISDRLEISESRTFETVLEIFYKLKLTKFLAIQPDLQYVFNPNGNGNNALAIGIRTIINF